MNDTEDVFIDPGVVLSQRYIDKLIEQFAQTSLTIDEFYDKLTTHFIRMGGLAKNSSNSKKSVSIAIAKSQKCLRSKSSSFRFYDTTNHSADSLWTNLNLRFAEGEYSTLFFFEKFYEVWENLDIRDEYELCDFLRKLVKQENKYNFKCVKTPIVIFGNLNRTEQAKQAIQKNNIETKKAFIKLYKEEFGLDKNFVNRNILPLLGDEAFFLYGKSKYRLEENMDKVNVILTRLIAKARSDKHMLNISSIENAFKLFELTNNQFDAICEYLSKNSIDIIKEENEFEKAVQNVVAKAKRNNLKMKSSELLNSFLGFDLTFTKVEILIEYLEKCGIEVDVNN